MCVYFISYILYFYRLRFSICILILAYTNKWNKLIHFVFFFISTCLYNVSLLKDFWISNQTYHKFESSKKQLHCLIKRGAPLACYMVQTLHWSLGFYITFFHLSQVNVLLLPLISVLTCFVKIMCPGIFSFNATLDFGTLIFFIVNY